MSWLLTPWGSGGEGDGGWAQRWREWPRDGGIGLERTAELLQGRRRQGYDDRQGTAMMQLVAQAMLVGARRSRRAAMVMVLRLDGDDLGDVGRMRMGGRRRPAATTRAGTPPRPSGRGGAMRPLAMLEAPATRQLPPKVNLPRLCHHLPRSSMPWPRRAAAPLHACRARADFTLQRRRVCST